MTRSLVVAVAVALLAGCGTGPDEVCSAARQHLQACFGPSAAAALASSCEPAGAERILQTDCSGLTQQLLDGKADSPVEDEVREAIRRAIREAILKGVQQALQAALSALGAKLSSYELYLLLYSSSSNDKAQAKARELADLAGDDPEFQPLVLRTGKRYDVVHGVCPLDLGTDLPRKIADLAMSNPKLLQALGGEVKVEATDEGEHIQLRLPLQLLPLARGTGAKLGCAE